MKTISFRWGLNVSVLICLASRVGLIAQPAEGFPGEFRPEFGGPPPFGPGGPMQEEIKLVKQFDQNGNGWLETQERAAARVAVKQQRANRPARGTRRPFGREETAAAGHPGVKVAVSDVKPVADRPLYDGQTLRTLFLDFAGTDWEAELEDFHGTDVEVPAQLTVDGKVYPNVGVHFRGASSYMMVSAGRKRSLNVAVDFVNEEQRLYGYRTLNLLNAHEDPTFLRSVLYLDIAREYVPAPKANFVRMVLNGESWGVYVSGQQFNKDFIKEWFGTTKGARWKVPGSPMGRAGLEYVGEDVAAYKKLYEIKSKDEPKPWADLINLCRVLNQTPAAQLEAALQPILDVDGVLKFLALENVFINNDGYWVRASDYSLYQDVGGKFHVLPHDVNETFSLPGGPGFGGGRGGRPPTALAESGASGNTQTSAALPPPSTGPGGGGRGGMASRGADLDPLVGLQDASKPLRAKLLAVPALRARYLTYVRELATKWLDWERLGPLAQRYQDLIAPEVLADTRKLDSYEAFMQGVNGTAAAAVGFRPGGAGISLKQFAQQRRAYLLSHPEVSAAR